MQLQRGPQLHFHGMPNDETQAIIHYMNWAQLFKTNDVVS